MKAREHTNHLAALFRKETSAMADFLVALSDFDRQRRWAELGHTSLFSFLARELHLSAGAAQARATAVRLIQQVPEVEAALREGQLCLTTINELAKVLTPENRDEILPRFLGLSRKTAAVLAASLQPAAVIPVRDVVTPVRTAARAVAEGRARPRDAGRVHERHPRARARPHPRRVREAARAVFGDALMDRYARKRPPPRTEATPALPFVRSQAP